jgi:pSer/pThr/pTyr-binding forkhead associated (FHA) protein
VRRAGHKTVIRVVEEEKERAIPLVGWLVVFSGAQRGEDFRLREGKNSIGSDAGNDIVLSDAHVSGRHASINTLMKDGERVFVLRDLDSANGTFLNADEEPRFYEELVDNDTVKFGTVVCKFKCV